MFASATDETKFAFMSITILTYRYISADSNFNVMLYFSLQLILTCYRIENDER